MRLIHTDNFGGDWPDEKFVTELPALNEATLNKIAAMINSDLGPTSHRYYKVVPEDYVLIGGFEP